MQAQAIENRLEVIQHVAPREPRARIDHLRLHVRPVHAARRTHRLAPLGVAMLGFFVVALAVLVIVTTALSFLLPRGGQDSL